MSVIKEHECNCLSVWLTITPPSSLSSLGADDDDDDDDDDAVLHKRQDLPTLARWTAGVLFFSGQMQMVIYLALSATCIYIAMAIWHGERVDWEGNANSSMKCIEVLFSLQFLGGEWEGVMVDVFVCTEGGDVAIPIRGAPGRHDHAMVSSQVNRQTLSSHRAAHDAIP